MRKRIFQIVQQAHPGDRVSRTYDIFMVIVALASIFPGMFHLENQAPLVQFVLGAFDLVSVYILAFDYVLRWTTNDMREGKPGYWKCFVRYPFRPSAIVDLLSILPTLGVLPDTFLFLRALRAFRIFRYSRHMALIANLLEQERRTLGSVLVIALAYIFVIALIMFSCEPDTFTNFGDAVYWSTVTLTTIGFGDIHPYTDLGYLITSISSIVGVFVFALPAGIMTGGFLQQLRMRHQQRDNYYSETFVGDFRLKPLLFTPQKIRHYMKTHPKVRLYSAIMFLGIALNLVLYVFTSLIGQPFWLDTTGTALVACILEPTAGIIVAYVNNLVLALISGNAANLLFFAESAVVALAYGLLLPHLHEEENPQINTLKTVCIVIAARVAISFGLTLLLANDTLVSQYQVFYQNALLDAGLPWVAATLLTIVIDRSLDTIVVFFLVDTAISTLNLSHFNARIWVSQRKHEEDGWRPHRRAMSPQEALTASKEPATSSAASNATATAMPGTTTAGGNSATATVEQPKPAAPPRRRLRYQVRARRPRRR